MSATTIGELVGYIRAETSDFERGLATSQLRMEGFRLDTAGRLRDLRGRFVTSSAVMERALTGVGDEMGEVATQTVIYSSVVDRESRTMEARLRAVEHQARRMGSALASRFAAVSARLRGMSVDTDRLKTVGAHFGRIAMSVGGVAAKLGTAVPLAAGLVSTLGQVAPAAGVAVTGMFAMVLATQTLKLGMKGVGDAVKAAMDPSDPAAFEEAIKNLAPSARSFAREVKTLQPQLKALQQGVQERLFKGFDGILREMGKSTLPVLRNGLFNTAGALNLMGRNIGNTAIGMSKSGVLGRAISGANTGLYNMSRLPSQIMLGLTQVGAAAAPAFGRLTAAAGAGADKLSDRISKAFENGAMEKAIDRAISLIGQLGSVVGNVFSIIGSILSAAEVSGGGFIGALKEITGELKKAFASPAVQSGLKAIFQTMATLAQTVGPLLVMALQAIAPVFTALGPPVQRLIQMLGKALEPVIKALGPVLEAMAVAIGAVIDAFSPLLPVIGQLIAALLPALTPLLSLVTDIFKQLAPVVLQLAQVLLSALQPILAALAPALKPIVEALGKLAEAILPVVTALMEALAPVIGDLAKILAELLVALAPVVTQLIIMIADTLTKALPVILPVIEVIGKLAKIFTEELAVAIRDVVVPALQALVSFLEGDFKGAWDHSKIFIANALTQWIRLLTTLPGRAWQALSPLANSLAMRAVEAGARLHEGIRTQLVLVVQRVQALPGQARAALSGIGSALWEAGSRLIGGFIDGIRSRFQQVRSTLSHLTGMLPDWKGPAAVDAKILTPAGQSLIEGFQRGITSATPGLQAQLGGLTGALPGMVGGAAGGGMATGGPGRLIVELAGPQEMKSLIRRIVQVDGRGSVQTAFG
ncbi:hypothetical protein OOK31_25585 [Streptomyces sp. NBC_00249]|uniref:phage tail protein n=1 Tax=Streptomyces sp. NBC_00249 TaxID=2975690 RepID=UPI0022589EBD|nr:hypothetical protein [Streptomyces sp. NBC_00249]MCX5197230.1 hypothetical protein [Streptomyces sp. NBC_00249]